jgi:hypothetical protein
VLLVFGFAGILLAFLNGLTVFQSNRARTWPTTPGLVLTERTWKDTGWHPTNMGHTARDLSTQSAMTYAYAVNNQRLVGRAISYDFSRRAPFAEAHPAGSTVSVHYNPANPTDAVVDPGCDRATLVYLFFGVVLMSPVAAFVVSNLLKRRELGRSIV